MAFGAVILTFISTFALSLLAFYWANKLSKSGLDLKKNSILSLVNAFLYSIVGLGFSFMAINPWIPTVIWLVLSILAIKYLGDRHHKLDNSFKLGIYGVIFTYILGTLATTAWLFATLA